MDERMRQARFQSGGLFILLVLFVVLSIVFLVPLDSSEHDVGSISSELLVKETSYSGFIRHDYIDADGNIVYAIDKHYASLIEQIDLNGMTEKELFLNVDDNPEKQVEGYYGVAYTYSINDRVRTITYLDETGNACKTTNGYAIKRQTCDSNGNPIFEYYFDEQAKPIKCVAGYYGIQRYYDNGRYIGLSYLGRTGEVITSSLGYAKKTYQYNEQTETVTEMYYAPNGEAVYIGEGQYGIRYCLNESSQATVVTYLDADGNPAPTTAGYTILKRSYHRDGTIDTDMYFDADGNQIALSKGQYGIKHSGKVNLLLDKNGRVMLCVDNILNGFPFMVVISGCVICLLILVLPKKLSALLTAAYVVFILYETLMFRESGDARTNFVLFSYADRFLTEQSVRVGVINNIWLFVPFGTGLYKLFQKKWVLLIPFVMSVAIETTQYITGLGIAEFDDVFGNTLGGWIGVLAAYTMMTWSKKKVSHHLLHYPTRRTLPLPHRASTSQCTDHSYHSRTGSQTR